MDPSQLLDLLTSHNYLALAVVLIGWSVQMLGPDSKFPLTIPLIAGRDPKPLIVAVLSMAYAVVVAVSGGSSWADALKHGALTGLLTMGLFDLVVKFAFNGNVPAWLNALALIFPKKDPPPPAA